MNPNTKPTSSIRYAPVDYPSYGDLRHPPPAARQRLFSLGWIWEILATIGSAGCMVAVVVILRLMEDKPLSDWTISVSLNAIVAIFITAAKSMAMLSIAACIAQSKWILFKLKERRIRELDLFEDAARGPLGSLLLLGHVRWGLGIASVGAIATIVALGVDAFAQQVIRFDTQNVEVQDGGASFKLSHTYNGSAVLQDQSVFIPDASTADMAMQGALFRGIYNMTTEPVFECNSTCVWKESYISLGFKSQCMDVTEPTLATNKKNTSAYENRMTTPGGIKIGAVFSYTSMQTKINVAAIGILPQFVDQTEGEPQDQKYPAEFVRFAVLRSPMFFSETGDEKKYLNALEIVECTLALTAYKYSNGSASGAQLDIRSDPIALEPATYKNTNISGDGWLVFEQPGIPKLQARRVDLLALIQLFNSTRFAGKNDIGESAVIPSGIGVALKIGSVSAAFDKMAYSMTEQLRSGSDEIAKGLSVKSVVFVRVRWAWLALPFGVILATILLLLVTVFNSWHHQTQLWKSSQTALLMHQVGLRGDSKAVLHSEIQSVKEAESFAKRTKARLE